MSYRLTSSVVTIDGYAIELAGMTPERQVGQQPALVGWKVAVREPLLGR